MNRTGCKIIYFGIESCVDRILKYYRKGITYEMAKDAIKKAQRAKFEIAGSFILGAPIETVDEMWETVNKAMKLDIDFAQFNQLIIARGIPLWDQLVQQGLIDDEKQWEEVIKGFELNPEISEEEFKELMVKFHRGFYFRKSYITKQIARTLMHRKRKVLLNLNQLGKLNREMKSILHIK